MLFENPISKEEAHKATIERAGSMGSALNAIFYLKIANVILTPIRAITLMTAAYAVGGSLFQNSGSVLNIMSGSQFENNINTLHHCGSNLFHQIHFGNERKPRRHKQFLFQRMGHASDGI